MTEAPLEDEPTFKLLNEARTIGVFQLESDGTRRLCRQMTISNVDEIIALIALYRPGPMDWIPDYIKEGRSIDYPVPSSFTGRCVRKPMGDGLSGAGNGGSKKDCWIYSWRCGYSATGDGKKKPEEMAKQREIFVKERKRPTVSNLKKPMIFSIFWRNLQDMDLINHIRLPMELSVIKRPT